MRVVMKVMIRPQGQIDHEGDFGDNLGAAAETGDKVTNVAVVLLDGEDQVFAGEELILRNEAVKAFLIVGQEGFALDPNFIEELLTDLKPLGLGVRRGNLVQARSKAPFLKACWAVASLCGWRGRVLRCDKSSDHSRRSIPVSL